MWLISIYPEVLTNRFNSNNNKQQIHLKGEPVFMFMCKTKDTQKKTNVFRLVLFAWVADIRTECVLCAA